MPYYTELFFQSLYNFFELSHLVFYARIRSASSSRPRARPSLRKMSRADSRAPEAPGPDNEFTRGPEDESQHPIN